MTPLADLIIGIENLNIHQLLAHWSWRIPSHLEPLFFSAFGDWFFRDRDDQIHMFDLVTGDLKKLADSRSEFDALLESEEYQGEWLMSHLVEHLLQTGVIRSIGQCYAFRTPPMLGGQLSPSNIVVWDLEAYQSGLSKIHQQIADLPTGTEVIIKK